MARKKKTPPNEDLAINLENHLSYDDDIESVSGIQLTDELVQDEPPKEQIIVEDNPQDSEVSFTNSPPEGNIHAILKNARSKINELKNEPGLNEHNNLIERLENLKKLRDSSQAQPNEFQQLLNWIKERNFNDRMDYIMKRIKTSHRDDDKLTLNANGEEIVVNRVDDELGEEEVVILPLGEKVFQKKKNSSHKKTTPIAYSNQEDLLKNENDNITITLSITQFRKILKDTVEDVLKELGIKNNSE
ncbi:hypothetical protein P344_03020 [Spiroplasma mirum ATCC 29335]|uniref:Uncharacterized protein n=1 Tax=Spiroplasma mirum ATCC 29335 TaxID=838561 RepID=W0GPD3_9MOLU|nr:MULTISPECIES: hypothetical protein [Spiroplasma]AHF60938.1 hypothetical protein SMM_0511 [Spiroplasma mirum ATCC 29335]AHI57948.1 hypothetical protein P344_03020 [Spiroplasma mirum ATCC 29335]AKM53044.1 hypothetical protein SATRI_v1c05650 [Spiroplasma atrichopogonis]